MPRGPPLRERACIPSQVLAKDFAKQMSQHNVAICLIECVAKDLSRAFAVSS
jgi:hypothetical protein